MAYPSALLQGIVAAAKKYGVPADVLIATTLVESGGNLGAVGDDGHSVGPFQENDNGRGRGLSPTQRMDPYASADRAAREFASYQARGLSGGALAAAAQRPADRAGYTAAVNAKLPEARAILAGAPAATSSGPVDANGDGIPDGGNFFAPGGAGQGLRGTDNDLAGWLSKLDPVGAVLGFIKDYAIRILVFLLVGVVGVWLIGQGASRAFGTPAPGQLVNRVTPGG